MTFPRILTIVTGIVAAAALCWVALFKIADSDVWWHLTAGNVMLDTGKLIVIDPFAYTREGLPYLATHEWLAQILFAILWNVGGPIALILLRIACLLLVAVFVLLPDSKRLWPHALLVLAAAIVMRQGIIERPQLLSIVCFAAQLWLCFRILDIPLEPTARECACRKRLFVGLFLIQLLWVNLHGGSALLTIPLLGAVFVQQLLEAWRMGYLGSWPAQRSLIALVLGMVIAFLILLLTPNTVHTFSYVWLLLSDRTAEFIAEWSPHSWLQYLMQIGPFWVVALVALIMTRRKPLALLMFLLGMGLLSRTASRHEVLFLITALACTVYSLHWNDAWQRFLDTLLARHKVAAILTTLTVLLLLWHINAPYAAFVERRNLTGFGAFAPAETAFNYVEQKNITGPMFNTYSLGGYLMFRGYPERKVFVDGRNVDYGFDFLKSALDAREDPLQWQQLQHRYGFTHAVIELVSPAPNSPLEFSYLDRDPSWSLVFVDDWVAVYVLGTSEHAALIAQDGYQILTPTMLLQGTSFAVFSPDDAALLETELKRQIASDPRGIHGLLLLSKLYATVHLYDRAAALAEEALARMPARSEPTAQLTAIRKAQEL